MLRQCAFARSVLYAAGRFDKEGFVGCVGVGPVLVVVVKAAFGQVCDVQQVFGADVAPSVFGTVWALSFAVCFWLRAFKLLR